jgi:hypothetical protein
MSEGRRFPGFRRKCHAHSIVRPKTPSGIINFATCAALRENCFVRIARFDNVELAIERFDKV